MGMKGERKKEVTHIHVIEFENDQKIITGVCRIHALLIKTSKVQNHSVEELQ
jgi:hypothetical protein